MTFFNFLLLVLVICATEIWQSEAGAVKEFHNFESLQKDLRNTDYAMVDFFASWCPHCVSLAPIFEEAATIVSKGALKDHVHLIKIQCDVGNRGEISPICSANKIQGFPTIYVYKKGNKFDQYQGDRTPEAIVKYVKDITEKGKAQFLGKHFKDQKVCMAKDFMKYVSHKS